MQTDLASNGDRLGLALAAAQRDRARADTLPPACYTDPEIFRWESRSLFRHSWIGVGRADRWREPGDYAAIGIAAVPCGPSPTPADTGAPGSSTETAAAGPSAARSTSGPMRSMAVCSWPRG